MPAQCAGESLSADCRVHAARLVSHAQRGRGASPAPEASASPSLGVQPAPKAAGKPDGQPAWPPAPGRSGAALAEGLACPVLSRRVGH